VHAHVQGLERMPLQMVLMLLVLLLLLMMLGLHHHFVATAKLNLVNARLSCSKTHYVSAQFSAVSTICYMVDDVAAFLIAVGSAASLQLFCAGV
jgi:hypothetical protein